MSKFVVEYKGYTLLCRPRPVGVGRFLPMLFAARDNGDSYEEHAITVGSEMLHDEDTAVQRALERGREWVDQREAAAGR